jgi:glycosyltransferase involved in cell wall biosynthesis
LLDILKYSSLKSWIFFNNYSNLFIRFKKQAHREKKIFKITKNFIGRTNWDRRITKVLSPNSNYFHNDEVLKEVFYEGKWQNKLEGTLQLFTTTGPSIYKGIETLIHCAYLLDLNNINFNWKVAGLNINDEFVRIAGKSVKKKLSKNIQFLGRADDNKLKETILNCNIYIAISHIENSPNSLCEALILGAPCIATYAGGTSSLLEDGKNGILIQDGDAYSMAGAIIELKENYNLAINYGINARNKALRTHDKNVIANDLLKIYQDILAKNTIKNEKGFLSHTGTY